MKYRLRVVLLSILLVVLLLLSLTQGAVPLSFAQLVDAFNPQNLNHFTLVEYRLPRVLIAVLVGAMLALSGALVQGVVRNPLASPDLLGINHGAGLSAVIAMIVWPHLSVSWLPAIALGGGLFAAAVLGWLVGTKRGQIRFAVTGVAVAAFFASSIDFLLLIKPLEINNAMLWLTGSLWGRNWTNLELLLPWAFLILPALALAKGINLLSLGDEHAISLGVVPRKTRSIALLLAVMLSAAAVSICGPLSFIGLIAPHLARFSVGASYQKLLPVTLLIGANLLLLADLVARTLAPPLELPAGIIIAVLGAPYFLWLLLRMR